MQGPVLVTGPRGFAGVKLLAQLGDRAVPTEDDVTDMDALAEAVRAAAPSAIVHLAAISSVAAASADPESAWRVNTLGVVNLLEAARLNAPDARVLIVSSGEVYGRTEQIPTPEDTPVAPVSQYAASKAAAEIAAGLAGRSGLGRRRRPCLPARGARPRRELRGRLLDGSDRPRRGGWRRHGARRRSLLAAGHRRRP